MTETVKCVNCACEIDKDESDLVKIHQMTHMLMDQLNQMPQEYGAVAMTQLLVSNSPYPKERFMEVMSEAWDNWNKKRFDEQASN